MGLTYDERLKNLTETVGPEDDVARMRELIAKHRWIFAKTYADFCPHEYTLRDQWTKRDWSFFVKFIWLYGMDANFGKQETKRYWFDHNTGYYYFLFREDTDEEGNDTEACCLINRANIKYFDFWEEEDLIERRVRCKVKPGGAKMAKEDREREGLE